MRLGAVTNHEIGERVSVVSIGREVFSFEIMQYNDLFLNVSKYTRHAF